MNYFMHEDTQIHNADNRQFGIKEKGRKIRISVINPRSYSSLDSRN
jgi:hypothetical protein